MVKTVLGGAPARSPVVRVQRWYDQKFIAATIYVRKNAVAQTPLDLSTCPRES